MANREVKQLSAFTWSMCDNETYPTTIEYAYVYPDPLVVPGSISLDMLAIATQDVNAPAKVEMVIERKVGDSWVEIPCNCTLEDICYMLSVIYPPNQPCPDYMTDHGVTCHCPIPAGTYNITGLTVDILLHIPQLATGDYTVQLTIFSVDVVITCFKIAFSLLAE
ncbi:GM2 ganglioside activator [Chamberlinius hualienensis]